MDCLHWQSLLAKPSEKGTHDSHMTITIVLALATLGGATKNINDPICVTRQVRKAMLRDCRVSLSVMVLH
jgi:hypothetical protein